MRVDLYTPFVLAYMRRFYLYLHHMLYYLCLNTCWCTAVIFQPNNGSLLGNYDSFVFHFDSSLLYNDNERPLIQKLYTVLFHLNSNWYSNKQQIYVILKSQ